jgi:hypothetical protein
MFSRTCPPPPPCILFLLLDRSLKQMDAMAMIIVVSLVYFLNNRQPLFSSLLICLDLFFFVKLVRLFVCGPIHSPSCPFHSLLSRRR